MPSLSSSAVIPRDICILRLSALGDVCNLVPSIRALQKAAPQMHITWVIGRAEYNLLEGLEGVEFLVYDKKTGLSGMMALRKTLLKQRQGRPFDALLHMQAALRASVLSRFIPAKRRIGFDPARAKDFQGWFVNEQLAAHEQTHVGEGFLDFVRYLGITHPAKEWDMPVTVKAEEEAARWINAQTTPYLLLSPCSSNRARNWRNWSAEGYAAVVDYAFQTYGLTTLITGGNSKIEQEMVVAITAAAESPLVNAVGQTSLKALLVLIRDARLVIAPDSGPIHMAVAMNTPPLGLYVTSNPQRTGPWLGQEWVVNRYPDAVRKYLGKEPEQVGWGQRVRDSAAMELISTEDVIARLDAIMNSKKPLGIQES
ncbi:MAG: glycosyltransferase family 9 protein [Marinospirillum sp.]|uniref:glycosyltransferase family 9 protein n=1 Tax=Marinospirillum sp. TaxID=2183934 RepID=UPI0019E6827A|nr:glycosyltransferase family 9 protein [Marinospirillum sp.]MBE0505130.1 glycosyltransferase family 9 protein [Marinospirillum sp.]